MNTESIDWSAELTANCGWLSRVVYARVGDHHVVEDVIQELGVAMSTWPRKLCGDDAVNRWLYAAAVKQALLYRRSRSRDQAKNARYAARQETLQEPASNPVQVLIASENVEWVRRAMQCLPARQREVLLLKHFESWSCREIAGKVGISESTVKRHLVNARKRLRIELLRQETKE